MDRHDWSGLASAAFEAALDEDRWVPWLHKATGAFQGVGGTFFVIRNSGQLDATIRCWGRAERIADEYMQGWWQHDPQIAAVVGLARSGTYVDTDHIDLSNRQTAEYMAWQRGVADFDHHMTAVALLGRGERRGGLSIHRANDAGPVPSADYRMLQTLFPQVKRALRLGYQHGEMLQAAFWDGIVTARPDQIAFLLDERGRVARHSLAAGTLISAHDGLDISNGLLVPSDSGEAASLVAIVAKAIRAFSPLSGAMRVARPSGRLPLILVCHPLPRTMRMISPLEAAALITVVDPHSRSLSQTSLYRQAFGLTRREAEFAAQIMNGHSVDSAAASLGMAIATARTHLRRLYEKTGTSGQSDLLRLLGQIAQ